MSPHRDGITGLIGQITERKTYTSSRSEFSDTSHLILAYLIIFIQENINLHHSQRFLRNISLRSDILLILIPPHQLRTVDIVKYFLNQ